VATVFAALVLEPVDADQPLAELPAQLPPSPQPLAPDSVTAPATSPTRPVAGLAGSWHVGVRSSFDYFFGGRALVGGDIFVASSWGRWVVAELGAGGRVGADKSLRSGQLTTRAATVTAAAGLELASQGRVAGSAIVVQAQAYLVHFDADQSG